MQVPRISPKTAIRTVIAVALALGAAMWLLSGLPTSTALAGAVGYGAIAALVGLPKATDYWPEFLLLVGVCFLVIGPSHYLFGAIAIAPWMAIRIKRSWVGLQKRIITEAKS